MKIREVMTQRPVTVEASDPVVQAAQAMRQHNIGDVVVRKDGKLCGIVTDRDIVVRVVGEGKDPRVTAVESICSHDMLSISPDQSTADAVKLMRERRSGGFQWWRIATCWGSFHLAIWLWRWIESRHWATSVRPRRTDN